MRKGFSNFYINQQRVSNSQISEQQVKKQQRNQNNNQSNQQIIVKKQANNNSMIYNQNNTRLFNNNVNINNNDNNIGVNSISHKINNTNNINNNNNNNKINNNNKNNEYHSSLSTIRPTNSNKNMTMNNMNNMNNMNSFSLHNNSLFSGLDPLNIGNMSQLRQQQSTNISSSYYPSFSSVLPLSFTDNPFSLFFNQYQTNITQQQQQGSSNGINNNNSNNNSNNNINNNINNNSNNNSNNNINNNINNNSNNILSSTSDNMIMSLFQIIQSQAKSLQNLYGKVQKMTQRINQFGIKMRQIKQHLYLDINIDLYRKGNSKQPESFDSNFSSSHNKNILNSMSNGNITSLPSLHHQTIQQRHNKSSILLQHLSQNIQHIDSRTLIKILFGSNKTYQYKLQLSQILDLPLYRQRNFSISLKLTDLQGKLVKNNNKIPLSLAIYSSQNPPKFIQKNTAGQKILKGYIQQSLHNGYCRFQKIQIKQVTSHFRNGWVFIVIIPCMTPLGNSNYNNHTFVDYLKIQPLVLEKIIVKAKKIKENKKGKEDNNQSNQQIINNQKNINNNHNNNNNQKQLNDQNKNNHNNHNNNINNNNNNHKIKVKKQQNQQNQQSNYNQDDQQDNSQQIYQDK